MVKKMIPEFAVKNASQAIEFYKKILNVEVLRIVTTDSAGVPANLNHSILNKSATTVDSLLKLNDDYFKVYEWNEQFDGPYNANSSGAFNFHLQFVDEKSAQKLWNVFEKHHDVRIVLKFEKKQTGDFWFMYGMIEDPFKVRWSFTYYPASSEIN